MGNKSIPTASTADEPSAASPAPAPRPWWDPGRVARRSAFPAALQALALGVLLFMIGAGWGLHGVDGVAADGALLYTNLATFGFWVVWFMALVLLLPVIGRLWCTVCPVGGCNDLAARVGLKKAVPRGLQNYGLMGLLLLGLTLGAELFTLNRYPDVTAVMLALVLAAAVAAGLVFKGRVFCRYACPIGGMAGLISRLAPTEVGSRDPAVCRRCESKACYYGSARRYRLSLPGKSRTFVFPRPGCPAFVFPPEAAGNAACLQCTQCFKNCPYDNLRWGAKPPLFGLWQVRVRDRSEALLVIVLTGIVFYRLARFWSALREGVEWPAAAIATHLDFVGPVTFKFLKLSAGFLLWPVLFFLLLAAAAKLASETRLEPVADGEAGAAGCDSAEDRVDALCLDEKRSWEAKRHTVLGYLATYCFAFIPLLAGAYAAFSVIKLNEKAAYLPLVLADPAGIRTWLAINQVKILEAPESLYPLTAVRWAALAPVVVGAVCSVWSTGRIGAAVYGAGSRAATRGAFVFRVGLVALSALMITCLKTWLFR
jgi:ferredoxin